MTTSIPAPLPPGPPPPTAEDIGTRIAMGRRMRRWTQAEFAARMLAVDPEGNWTYAKVSKAERGEQSVDAEVLGLIAMVQGLAITWYYELPYDGGSPGPWGTRVMGPYLTSRPEAKVIELSEFRAKSPIPALAR